MATQTRRNFVLIAAMAMTLLLVYWASESEQDAEIALAQPRQRSQPIAISQAAKVQSEAQSSIASLDWHALEGRAESIAKQDKSSDLFKSQTWYVPPLPKLAVVTPPPPPAAPPAPFAYLGKMESSPQGTLFFLSGSNKVYSVLVGANIDKSWRLDAEDAGNLRLTYLPLSLPQMLSKSAKSPEAVMPSIAVPVGATSTKPEQNYNQGTS